MARVIAAKFSALWQLNISRGFLETNGTHHLESARWQMANHIVTDWFRCPGLSIGFYQSRAQETLSTRPLNEFTLGKWDGDGDVGRIPLCILDWPFWPLVSKACNADATSPTAKSTSRIVLGVAIVKRKVQGTAWKSTPTRDETIWVVVLSCQRSLNDLRHKDDFAPSAFQLVSWFHSYYFAFRASLIKPSAFPNWNSSRIFMNIPYIQLYR
jgi:hypothetical protein